MIPGEIIIAQGDNSFHAGRQTVTLKVANTANRSAQVGWRSHFFEANPFLRPPGAGFRP